MEGVAAEAASLAGHLRLGNLIYLYLDNKITIEGDTGLAFTEEVGTRFLSYGWQVLRVEGENMPRSSRPSRRAKHSTAPLADHRPLAYRLRRPEQAGQPDAHGAPLGAAEIGDQARLRRAIPEHFVVPPAVTQHMEETTERGEALEAIWQRAFRSAARRLRFQALTPWLPLAEGLPAGWDSDCRTSQPAEGRWRPARPAARCSTPWPSGCRCSARRLRRSRPRRIIPT